MGAGWRIVKAGHGRTAFSGEGARLFGGRWNSQGIPVVYLSENRSLATLEILVHARPVLPRDKYDVFVATWDDALMETLPADKLPANWTEEPPPLASMQVGNQWVKEQRSAVLAVPSVIVPGERNFVLNPMHPQFSKIEIKSAGGFYFDPRLQNR